MGEIIYGIGCAVLGAIAISAPEHWERFCCLLLFGVAFHNLQNAQATRRKNRG